MRKLAVFALMTAFFAAYNVEAVTYNLFVHGLSKQSHCGTISGVNSATTDVNNYWGGAVTGLSNVRYIGFAENAANGAFSWSTCGAQTQFSQALQTFCKGSNNCNIYTHSTGGLVASYYFSKYNPAGVNINRIQLMANAAGGSELATKPGWLQYLVVGLKSDNTVVKSVTPTAARSSHDHNTANGRILYTTAGEKGGAASAFLPGEDDGVVANHSLCNIKAVADVDIFCTKGNATMSEKCGFLWKDTCYYYRWAPTRTVGSYSGDNHEASKKHYNKR
ncbi:MAG: hypothetical protein H3C43_10390 [Leptonema sp. (in: Bacteria)]|nr:hypothetical protein [Leptonema sp. (in: bacteria)]